MESRSAGVERSEMQDAQIHQSIEKLVAEEHELWEKEASGVATDEDVSDSSRSRSPSTRAGTTSASAARCARPVVTRMPQT